MGDIYIVINAAFQQIWLRRIHIVSKPRALTILTVRTLKSSSTQTAISSFCKTSLTGCFVLARVTNTGALLM